MIVNLPPTIRIDSTYFVSLSQREGAFPVGGPRQGPRHPFGPRLVPFRTHLDPFPLPRQPLARESISTGPGTSRKQLVNGPHRGICRGRVQILGTRTLTQSTQYHISVWYLYPHSPPLLHDISAWSGCHQPDKADCGSAPFPPTRVVGFASVAPLLPYGISAGDNVRWDGNISLGAAPEYENGK